MNTLEFIGTTAIITAFACLLGIMSMVNTAIAANLKLMIPQRRGMPSPPRKPTTLEFNLDVSPAIKAIDDLKQCMDALQRHDDFTRMMQRRTQAVRSLTEAMRELEVKDEMLVVFPPDFKEKQGMKIRKGNLVVIENWGHGAIPHKIPLFPFTEPELQCMGKLYTQLKEAARHNDIGVTEEDLKQMLDYYTTLCWINSSVKNGSKC